MLRCDNCYTEIPAGADRCPGCARERFPAGSPAVAQAAEPPCPQCCGPLALIVDRPQHGAGCILMLLGALSAPLLIGIPVLVYGVLLAGKTVRRWHCRHCGRQFPIDPT